MDGCIFRAVRKASSFGLAAESDLVPAQELKFIASSSMADNSNIHFVKFIINLSVSMIAGAPTLYRKVALPSLKMSSLYRKKFLFERIIVGNSAKV